ncbi:hypothetical protein R5R35_007718 [Gryllus longicercus]|uniref:Integrase catalytic domain-containing protein n=2 Tax=Gryllus longicercus TaxID=2509291 RepID=A0AAN9VKR4_9ORTH
MIKSGVISGITLSDEDEILCESCLYGKQHRFHHASREVREEEVGERVFSDVCGPIATESSGGARYFVLFKDSATSYLVVRTMKHKSDVLTRLKEYVRMVEKQQGRKVKVLHCDNGREYLNESLQEYLKREGIILENTSPYTPQQNGRIEREMRTVMESARSMMHAMNTPKYLWGEAVNTAVYILNRTPTSEKRSTTPYEAFMGRKPSLSHLKKFGCTAFMHVPDCRRTKLDDKSSKLMFVGYDGNSDNYRLFDPTTKKVKVSRNVIFDEHTTIDTEKKAVQISIAQMENGDDNAEEYPGGRNQIVDLGGASKLAAPEAQRPAIRNLAVNETEPRQDLDGEQFDANPRNVEALQEDEGTVVDNARDYNLRNRDKFQRPGRYTANFAMVNEPLTYKEAMEGSESREWSKAIAEELGALKRNDTWQLMKQFEITVMEPGHFVGMEILDETDEGNNRRLLIHQSSYIRRMIEKFHMQDAAPVGTPADPHVRLKEPVQEPTNLKMDNQGALCLVKNPVFHKRTKHVDIKYHYIREKLEEGTISVSFVPSDLELADVFTKPTPRDHFHKLIFNLGMRKC